MTSELDGIIPVLATPFTASGEVDYESFAAVLDHAIAQGAHAVAMFGLASEFYKLDTEERRRLTKQTVDVTRCRIPAIISVTEHATELATKRAREAVEAGADAVMILPPFFLNPPAEAIIEHVREVAAAAEGKPVILQYAPAQTGMPPEVLRGLRVDYVKVDAFPSFAISGIRTMVGYMGLDLPDAVEAGCIGCMPTVSLTRGFGRVWDALQREPNAGRAQHARLKPLLEFMMQSIEFLIASEKRILAGRGIIQNAYARRPSATLSTMQIAELDRMLEQLSDLL